MKKVISVRFKENGKSYYFDPGDAVIHTGEYVIVETARGVECGEVVQGVRELADAAVPKALKPITRMADSVDIAILVGKKHTQPIVDGLTKAGFPQENIHVVGSLEESTTLLHGMMRSGDVVLYENDLPDNYSE